MYFESAKEGTGWIFKSHLNHQMTSATSERMHVHRVHQIKSLAPLSWDTSLHALLPLRQHALEHISSPPRCSPVWPWSPEPWFTDHSGWFLIIWSYLIIHDSIQWSFLIFLDRLSLGSWRLANLDTWAAQRWFPPVLQHPHRSTELTWINTWINVDKIHLTKFHKATENTPLEKLPASSSQTFELGDFFPGFDDGLLLCQCSCIRLQDVCSLLWP